MIECKVLNNAIGEISVFIAEDELSMIADYYKYKDDPNTTPQDKRELDINPKVLEWLMEDEEFKKKATDISNFLEIPYEEFSEIFVRVIAYGERKGAIICVQDYNTKEEFLERLYPYFEEFMEVEYDGKIPPDFMMNMFVCLNYFKFGRSETEAPDNILIHLLNIKGPMPDFENPPATPEAQSEVLPDNFEKIKG